MSQDSTSTSDSDSMEWAARRMDVAEAQHANWILVEGAPVRLDGAAANHIVHHMDKSIS